MFALVLRPGTKTPRLGLKIDSSWPHLVAVVGAKFGAIALYEGPGSLGRMPRRRIMRDVGVPIWREHVECNT